jgi:hypothetical protein
MKIRRKRMLLILGVFLFLLALKIPLFQAQLSTCDHLADPGFWPTKDGEARSDYVGSNVCASCHVAKAASKKQHRWISSCTLQRVRGLAAHSDMNFKVRTTSTKSKRCRRTRSACSGRCQHDEFDEFARLNPDRPSADDRAFCTPNPTIIVVNSATNMRVEESRCCNEAR